MTKKRLGELMIEAGLIDDIQLQSALGHQRQWGGRIGQVLVQMGFVKEPHIVRILSQQLGIPIAEAPPDEMHARVLAEIPLEIAAQHTVFPLALRRDAKGEGLVLAMADPTNVDAIDAVQFKSGKRVSVMLAGETQIETWIRQHYHGERQVQPSGNAATVRQSQAAMGGVQFGGQEVELSSGDSDDDIPVVTGAIVGAPTFDSGPASVPSPGFGAPSFGRPSAPDPFGAPVAPPMGASTPPSQASPLTVPGIPSLGTGVPGAFETLDPVPHPADPAAADAAWGRHVGSSPSTNPGASPAPTPAVTNPPAPLFGPSGGFLGGDDDDDAPSAAQAASALDPFEGVSIEADPSAEPAAPTTAPPAAPPTAPPAASGETLPSPPATDPPVAPVSSLDDLPVMELDELELVDVHVSGEGQPLLDPADDASPNGDAAIAQTPDAQPADAPPADEGDATHTPPLSADGDNAATNTDVVDIATENASRDGGIGDGFADDFNLDISGPDAASAVEASAEADVGDESKDVDGTTERPLAVSSADPPAASWGDLLDDAPAVEALQAEPTPSESAIDDEMPIEVEDVEPMEVDVDVAGPEDDTTDALASMVDSVAVDGTTEGEQASAPAPAQSVDDVDADSLEGSPAQSAEGVDADSTETGPDAAAETGPETGTETGTETGPETNADTGTQGDAETGTQGDAEGTGTQGDAESDAEINAETGTQGDAPTDVQGSSDVDPEGSNDDSAPPEQCPNCQNPRVSSARFCPFCGQGFADAAVSTVPQPSNLDVAPDVAADAAEPSVEPSVEPSGEPSVEVEPLPLDESALSPVLAVDDPIPLEDGALAEAPIPLGDDALSPVDDGAPDHEPAGLADAWADAAEKPIPRPETDTRGNLDWVPPSREIVTTTTEDQEPTPEPVVAYRPAAPATPAAAAPWATLAPTANVGWGDLVDEAPSTSPAAGSPASPDSSLPTGDAPRLLELDVDVAMEDLGGVDDDQGPAPNEGHGDEDGAGDPPGQPDNVSISDGGDAPMNAAETEALVATEPTPTLETAADDDNANLDMVEVDTIDIGEAVVDADADALASSDANAVANTDGEEPPPSSLLEDAVETAPAVTGNAPDVDDLPAPPAMEVSLDDLPAPPAHEENDETDANDANDDVVKAGNEAANEAGGAPPVDDETLVASLPRPAALISTLTPPPSMAPPLPDPGAPLMPSVPFEDAPFSLDDAPALPAVGFDDPFGPNTAEPATASTTAVEDLALPKPSDLPVPPAPLRMTPTMVMKLDPAEQRRLIALMLEQTQLRSDALSTPPTAANSADDDGDQHGNQGKKDDDGSSS